MPSLIIKDANGKREIPIVGKVTIGRHPSNTICIKEQAVSKNHAVIRQAANNTYIFEDLNSSNGSYCNELRIQDHKFKTGDIIRVGQSTIEFKDFSQAEDDVNSLVNFEKFDPQKTQYQERVQLSDVGRFLPEREVNDVNMLRIDYEKLRMGQELLQDIGDERNIKVLLDTISKKLIQMFMADRCVILLVNAAGDFDAKAVQSVDKLDGPVSVSQTVLKEVQASKSAVLLAAGADENKLSQASSLMLMGIKSVMCAPVLHNNQVIGAVQLDLQKGHLSFSKKDLQLLGGIVTYIAMAVSNAGLSKKIEQEAKTTAQFERLLSPSVVNQLIKGELKIGKAGELRQVTILFADIRGFTSMSQKASPAAVVNMLNQYYERVVDIVFRFGGTLDKFIGDEVMVLFGAPIPMKNQENAALACALEIQKMLTVWNKERAASKHAIIPVGIGINSGEVVVGSIGSTKTMQYTCVGNAVNIASRLTGLAKAGQIIASKATMVGVKGKIACDKLPPADIKGIQGQVQVYVVKGMKNNKQTDTVDE